MDNKLPSGEYAIYLRKSRADIEAEAHGEGETLARHKRILTELAERHNYNITELYSEIVSGETISARPMMQKLLSDVGAGRFEGVLVMEIERLARGDTVDQGIVAQTFKYAGTKIITPTKTYDPENEFDEEYFEFGLFMSRREYKTINRRIQRGRVASAQEGNWVGNKTPYGYKRVKLASGNGYTLETVPEEAEIIRMIFKLYAEGEGDGRIGINQIARRLTDLGIKPKYSEKWSPASIRDILRNETYIGMIRWNRRKTVKKIVNGEMELTRPRNKEYTSVKGKHPAIVNNELYKSANDILKSHMIAAVPGNNNIQNPLSGLIVCSVCGRHMVRRPYTNGYPDTLMCPNPYCSGNVSSFLYLVENRLKEMLNGWLRERIFENETNKIVDYLEPLQKSSEEIEEEITQLNKQLNKLFDLLERDIYDEATFQARSAELKAKIKDAKSKKADIDNKLTAERKRKETREGILPKVEILLANYDNMSAAQKNNSLKEILDKVVYKKDEGGRWAKEKIDDFTLILYPNVAD